MIKKLCQDAENKIKKTIESFGHELTTIRTGRASVSLVEHIKVEYYGAPVPVNQIANISVPEARLIEIKPWDKAVIGAIEKAVLKSDLGINPVNDGKVIRLALPSLTEDRRKDLVKLVKKIGEKYKVATRNIRREEIEVLKKAEKEKQISEDDMYNGEEFIQKIIDDYIKKIDEIIEHKDKEIMEI